MKCTEADHSLEMTSWIRAQAETPVSLSGFFYLSGNEILD